MTVSLQEFADRYVIPMGGEPVGLIQLDFRLTYFISDFQLTFETGFTVEDDDQSHWIDPEKKDTLLPGLRLFNRRVASAIAYKNGQLRVLFEDGAAIRSLANEAYEAWQFQGVGGLRIVCMPGGELAVWSNPAQRRIEWLPGRRTDDP